MKRFGMIGMIIVLVVLTGCAASSFRFEMEPGEGEYILEYETKHDKETAIKLIDEYFDLNPGAVRAITRKATPELGRFAMEGLISCTIALVRRDIYHNMLITYDEGKMKYTMKVGTIVEWGSYPPKNSMEDVRFALTLKAINIQGHLDQAE